MRKLDIEANFGGERAAASSSATLSQLEFKTFPSSDRSPASPDSNQRSLRGLTAKRSGILPISRGLASPYSGVLPHLLMIESQVSPLLSQPKKPTSSNRSASKLKNQFSHLTAIERINLSFPANFLFSKNLIQGKVLDFGCGLGNDVKLLQRRGLDITGYDPHYFPQYPNAKFDTIICLYVLNVLFPEEQAHVLMEVSHLLKPGGKAYYAVRRDIKQEGFREHYIHKKPTYQCISKLPFNSIHLDESCEIYEYTHYNHQIKSSNSCIFCNPHSNLTILTESATAYAILDGYPLSKGHALIVPKRHIANYFELPFKEQSACWFMANKVQEILNKEFHPDGFNVGMNINREAGQKMMHANIHIIPRYQGDAVSAKGGMRNVIPKKSRN